MAEMLQEVYDLMKEASDEWHDYTGERPLSTAVLPASAEMTEYYSWVFDFAKDNSG